MKKDIETKFLGSNLDDLYIGSHSQYFISKSNKIGWRRKIGAKK